MKKTLSKVLFLEMCVTAPSRKPDDGWISKAAASVSLGTKEVPLVSEKQKTDGMQ